MVTMLAFYSDNLSSHPTKVHNFCCVIIAEQDKNRKRISMGMVHKKLILASRHFLPHSLELPVFSDLKFINN